MKLRAYQSGDLPAILNLFRDTVHTVCARGYTRAQLDAWAPAELDAAAWDASCWPTRPWWRRKMGASSALPTWQRTAIWTGSMSTGTGRAGEHAI